MRITAVAHQVVRLGDQLEGVHIPRARVLEAKNLMVHFARFHRDGTLPSDLFDDPEQVRLLYIFNTNAGLGSITEVIMMLSRI